MSTRAITTHHSCDDCWHRIAPDRPFPLRITYNGRDLPWDTCCWCGTWNNSGIYVRTEQPPLFCQHGD
jgi:hypothetical protein